MKLEEYSSIESTNIDYKEIVERKKPKSWLKSVSAFANTRGGILLFGVRDGDKEAIGLKNIESDSEYISEQINTKISPIPRFELRSFNKRELNFLEVKIGDGPFTPYYYEADGRKEAFIRSGNQSVPAEKYILDELILKGQNKTFDELPSVYYIGDVSFTLLNATLKKETGKEIDTNKDYLSMNLITTDKKITNAGLLFCDQGLLVQSRIFCTRWNGIVRGAVVGDAIDDKEYTGSIISLLDNSEAFIKNNSKNSWYIDGMKRIEKEDYPLRAVREAIVNAIIHRDYQIKGSEIHIDMFDDRLEITSPGGMFDGTFIQDLDIKKVSSIRRNRIISDIFSRLHYMERRGSGLTRIVESYNDNIQKPNFYSDSSIFKTIIPNKSYNTDKIEKDNNDNIKGNFVSDNDYFILQIYKNIHGVTKKTYEQIENIFNNYGYLSDFKREDVEMICSVKRSRAQDIINILINANLIQESGPLKYKFKK